MTLCKRIFASDEGTKTERANASDLPLNDDKGLEFQHDLRYTFRNKIGEKNTS